MLRVAQSFYRRDFSRHFTRLPAGNQHCDDRKKCRADKDSRICGSGGVVNAVVVRRCSYDDRRKKHAGSVAKEKSHGDTDHREKQRLHHDDLFNLLSGSAYGFQKTVIPDISCH